MSESELLKQIAKLDVIITRTKMYKIYRNDNWVVHLRIVDSIEEGIQVIDELITESNRLKALPKEKKIFFSKRDKYFAEAKKFTIREFVTNSFDEQPILYSKNV